MVVVVLVVVEKAADRVDTVAKTKTTRKNILVVRWMIGKLFRFVARAIGGFQKIQMEY